MSDQIDEEKPGSQPAFALRSYYVNFASHLLNAWNVNLVHPQAGGEWGRAEFAGLLDMIRAFGFNCFEYWLEPTLYADGPESERGRRFVQTMQAVLELAHARGLLVKYILAPNTFGQEWYYACPNEPQERDLILTRWRQWAAALRGTDVVGIFPGDPGGCNRRGCDHETYLELAVRLTEITLAENPGVTLELGTWGTPFSGWGEDLLAYPAWNGKFADIHRFASERHQCFIWHGTPERAERAMASLMRRLPHFPADLLVAINLGFSPDSDCTHGGDARGYVRELAKHRRVTSWEYALTEGELVVYPHFRVPRIMARRREERTAAPYHGATAYTMSPMLSQLSMYAAGQSALAPDADPDRVARQFCREVFGPEHERLGELFEAFEVVPGWGHYPRRRYSRGEAGKVYREIIDRLESADMAGCRLPLFPSPDKYRRDLLWFARQFLLLAGDSPDREAIRREYARVCHGIYDLAPAAVDERSAQSARQFSQVFQNQVG